VLLILPAVSRSTPRRRLSPHGVAQELHAERNKRNTVSRICTTRAARGRTRGAPLTRVVCAWYKRYVAHWGPRRGGGWAGVREWRERPARALPGPELALRSASANAAKRSERARSNASGGTEIARPVTGRAPTQQRRAAPRSERRTRAGLARGFQRARPSTAGASARRVCTAQRAARGLPGRRPMQAE
jgi:hypothetical protein